MAIVINGSGTVTGLAVGGLPDGTVDAGTLATDSVTAAKLEVSAITGADLPAGSVLQVVSTQTSSGATTTASTPSDNTIPQISEGTEFMTLAITPTSSSSKLFIQVNFYGQISPANWFSYALFQDSTANALAANRDYQSTNTAGSNQSLTHYMTAGTTSATTFRFRVGTGGQTFSFNSDSGNGIFGGVLSSSMTIMEIAG